CSVGDGSSFAIEILDVHEGIIFNLETSGVIGFTVAYGQPIRDPPYFDMVIEDSRFLMTPNERFSQYEENEISSIIDIITTFRCSDGMNIFRTFTIQLIDTNNHAPVFIPPPGHYHYVLDAPTPPGYHVTGCLSDLIARDVDLTTEKIIFEIEENPFFSITYSAEMSIDGSKEFKAIVTTKTFVRNFPQEMTLDIKATDVHGTPGQGVQTTNGQITITGNKNFVLPDEPVFSKTIYTGIYTTDLPINQVVLDELISLQHGYDDLVRFSIDGLVPLKFERAHYEGTIENNVLHLPPLLLSQGYEDSIVSADFVLNEYSEPYIQAFRADVQEGVVTVSMSALDQTVIDQNNFIYLQIEATATSGTATSVITLEIIKDDNVTPVFEKPIYTGSYEPGKELIIEQISFSQGYDGVDSLLFDGEHKTYFAASRNGPHVTIEVSNIPPELFNLGRIELSLQATKPRTVGATTTVIVTLPAVVPLKFERAHYEGKIENNVLHLPPLLLSQGYEDSIVSADFVLNEYSEPYIQAFRADVQEGVVTVSMSALDQTVIDQNNFIYLQIEATATSGTATSVITLEIIKDDNVTPVFEKPIYTGSYEPGKELIIEQISFSQGYDGVDSLLIDGVVPLKFERAHYEGTIENNVLHLPPLLLSQGYEDSIVSADFVLNEYSEPYIQAFTADVQEGVVTVSMSALDQTVIDQNNFIYLQIEATATSGTATSVITLEIIKDDNVTPVFEKPIYTGSYEPGKELIIEQISFSQGYDGVDSLLIDGGKLLRRLVIDVSYVREYKEDGCQRNKII
ncbi:hypothetical protein HF086_010789, partial [Spodoptera exigua]